MNFLTHIMISKALCRQFSGRSELNRRKFCYGGIKPDLFSGCLQNPHIIDNYLFLVRNQFDQLITQGASAANFSEDLGIVCHYICDFFCYYHQNTEIHHKLLRHFFYEMHLHFILCSMLQKNAIKGDSKIELPADTGKNSKKNIASLVVEMRKEYIRVRKTARNDIEYAFAACISACELILLSPGEPSEKTSFTNPA